jgi:hypothetical protein
MKDSDPMRCAYPMRVRERGDSIGDKSGSRRDVKSYESYTLTSFSNQYARAKQRASRTGIATPEGIRPHEGRLPHGGFLQAHRIGTRSEGTCGGRSPIVTAGRGLA